MRRSHKAKVSLRRFIRHHSKLRRRMQLKSSYNPHWRRYSRRSFGHKRF